MNTSLNKISFVGTGPVARSFALLADAHSAFELDFVIGRSLNSAEKVLKGRDSGSPSQNLEDLALSDLVFLAVPDDKIKSLASEISLLDKHFVKKSYTFCHFSGAYSSEILNDLKTLSTKNREINLSSLHPLVSFSEAIESVEKINGVNIALEGEAKILNEFLKEFDVKSFSVTKNQKLKYHAAAVFCSNYLLTVMNTGIEILKEVDENIDPNAFFDLAAQTLNKARQTSPEAALTGPIERGDFNLVENQLAELAKSTKFSEFYRVLAKETLKIASKKNNKSSKSTFYKKLKDILE